jgi:hypothetical protein
LQAKNAWPNNAKLLGHSQALQTVTTKSPYDRFVRLVAEALAEGWRLEEYSKLAQLKGRPMSGTALPY